MRRSDAVLYRVQPALGGAHVKHKAALPDQARKPSILGPRILPDRAQLTWPVVQRSNPPTRDIRSVPG